MKLKDRGKTFALEDFNEHQVTALRDHQNVNMVLSRRSDQFHRDSTVCGHLQLFGLMACNETEESTATAEACLVLVLVDLR